jgi:AraC-like DNA-binding protein/ligand-binding sensor protein
LARLPVVKRYAEAFRKATGVTLAVVPIADPALRCALECGQNEFCSLSAGTLAGFGACSETHLRAQRGAASQRAPKQVVCYAGMTEVAVPVVVRGLHVATLMSGQVFRREPTQRDFDMVLKFIGAGQDRAWAARLHSAYFGVRAVNAERFEAVVELLTLFAKLLADHIENHVAELSPDDPPAVASAKRFIQEHRDEPIALAQVVDHVRVSRFHFCKVFKKATGMTLTEYVTRARLERAKVLLRDPALRISEVVFASGFGSIPRFNSVFKHRTGMAPTAYRVSVLCQAQP